MCASRQWLFGVSWHGNVDTTLVVIPLEYYAAI